MHHLRVIIADGYHDAAESLALYLQLQGCNARTAHGGDEAIALAKHWHPDAVVVDLRLPRGFELLGRMRRECGRIRIVGVVSHMRAGDRERARESGCDVVMLKASEPAAILRALSPGAG